MNKMNVGLRENKSLGQYCGIAAHAATVILDPRKDRDSRLLSQLAANVLDTKERIANIFGSLHPHGQPRQNFRLLALT